eukprot:CAMPEP_0114976560 /NCGR_PEP_ID=MMETSP0216-20121206/2741_1 /TAXON_ID=223996 /ORGANISM="Protocruzia adherens, Strain Boccale" /LENGTH=500 /DNA_ID=CAMNT_0002337503 /DNA_START=26 /DNA_END=1524 /DNA_ORIENTATION=+
MEPSLSKRQPSLDRSSTRKSTIPTEERENQFTKSLKKISRIVDDLEEVNDEHNLTEEEIFLEYEGWSEGIFERGKFHSYLNTGNDEDHHRSLINFRDRLESQVSQLQSEITKFNKMSSAKDSTLFHMHQLNEAMKLKKESTTMNQEVQANIDSDEDYWKKRYDSLYREFEDYKKKEQFQVDIELQSIHEEYLKKFLSLAEKILLEFKIVSKIPFECEAPFGEAPKYSESDNLYKLKLIGNLQEINQALSTFSFKTSSMSLQSTIEPSHHEHHETFHSSSHTKLSSPNRSPNRSRVPSIKSKYSNVPQENGYLSPIAAHKTHSGVLSPDSKRSSPSPMRRTKFTFDWRKLRDADEGMMATSSASGRFMLPSRTLSSANLPTLASKTMSGFKVKPTSGMGKKTVKGMVSKSAHKVKHRTGGLGGRAVARHSSLDEEAALVGPGRGTQGGHWYRRTSREQNGAVISHGYPGAHVGGGGHAKNVVVGSSMHDLKIKMHIRIHTL